MLSGVCHVLVRRACPQRPRCAAGAAARLCRTSSPDRQRGCLPGCPLRIQHFFEMGRSRLIRSRWCVQQLAEQPWMRLTGRLDPSPALGPYEGLYDEAEALWARHAARSSALPARARGLRIAFAHGAHEIGGRTRRADRPDRDRRGVRGAHPGMWSCGARLHLLPELLHAPYPARGLPMQPPRRSRRCRRARRHRPAQMARGTDPYTLETAPRMAARHPHRGCAAAAAGSGFRVPGFVPARRGACPGAGPAFPFGRSEPATSSTYPTLYLYAVSLLLLLVRVAWDTLALAGTSFEALSRLHLCSLAHGRRLTRHFLILWRMRRVALTPVSSVTFSASHRSGVLLDRDTGDCGEREIAAMAECEIQE